MQASRLDDWLQRIEQRHSGSIELGLERCAEVWRRMGCPRPARQVITVAGTNGKGSTVAGIESGLAFLGRRVGSYTSPHLIRYNERIRIGERNAPDDSIVAGFEAVDSALGETRLTYFEFGTLAAFATMARECLDFAVLEVGLGGRLDAVNLIDADLAVITPIGLDHQEYLGSDRESIGREKAGIMRPGQTVVCSDRDPPLSVLSVASDFQARLVRLGPDFDVSRSAGEGEWRYFFGNSEIALPVSMAGGHQADNLAAALTAILLCGVEVVRSLKGLAAAVAGCRVRGRLERIGGRPEVIVDVGHNPLAGAAVGEFLDGLAAEPCRAVLGMLGDKDAEGFVSALGGRVSSWYCGGLAGSRGQAGDALASRVRATLPASRVGAFDTVPQALDAAIADSQGQGVVLVLGSFLTAGEAIIQLEAGN